MGNKKYKGYLKKRKDLKKKIAAKYFHKWNKKAKKWVPIKSSSLLNLAEMGLGEEFGGLTTLQTRLDNFEIDFLDIVGDPMEYFTHKNTHTHSVFVEPIHPDELPPFIEFPWLDPMPEEDLPFDNSELELPQSKKSKRPSKRDEPMDLA